MLVGASYHFFLPSWCFFCFLTAISSPVIPAYPGIQQSSTVFPDFCRFAMVCFSFRTFSLERSSCKQLFDSANIEKYFPFVADIVFRAR